MKIFVGSRWSKGGAVLLAAALFAASPALAAKSAKGHNANEKVKAEETGKKGGGKDKNDKQGKKNKAKAPNKPSHGASSTTSPSSGSGIVVFNALSFFEDYVPLIVYEGPPQFGTSAPIAVIENSFDILLADFFDKNMIGEPFVFDPGPLGSVSPNDQTISFANGVITLGGTLEFHPPLAGTVPTLGPVSTNEGGLASGVFAPSLRGFSSVNPLNPVSITWDPSLVSVQNWTPLFGEPLFLPTSAIPEPVGLGAGAVLVVLAASACRRLRKRR